MGTGREGFIVIDLLKSTLELSLERPLKLLHVTDSHLPLCDARDDAQKQALAARRQQSFPQALDNLREQIAYAEENCDLLAHTGDLMDFVSRANVEKAREILKNPRIFFIAGNHEYTQYMGEAWEDNAYRMNSYIRMGGLGVNMFYNSRALGGVNLVAIDNGYHQVEDWQTERLAMEERKGLPILLMLHVPLFEPELYARAVRHAQDGSAYLMGCDEEHLLPYPEFRAMEQRPSAATRRFVDYLNGPHSVKAILTGHVHFSFESRLPCGAMQYVTGGGMHGVARELTIL